MKNFTENITPDSFTGSICALESVKNSITLLNGPTGCKFYHSAMIDDTFMRSENFDPLPYEGDYFFGQKAIPCTFLDSDDYVYGSGEKLEGALKLIRERDPEFIGLVNSPGAALIGDDLDSFLRLGAGDITNVAIETSGYSQSFGQGYEETIIAILDSLDLKKLPQDDKSCNILGIQPYQKYAEGNLHVVSGILESMGIKINVNLFDQDIKEISQISKAKYNLILYPEYGRRVGDYLKEQFEQEPLEIGGGLPIGFNQVENFIKTVSKAFDTDPSKLLEELGRARARAYLYLSRYSSLLGLPKGALYSIKAEPSLALPLMRFLSDYLAMIPAAIDLLEDVGGENTKDIEKYLHSIDSHHVLDKEITKTPTDFVFADGLSIIQLQDEARYKGAMEILMPSLGYLDIVEKSFLGSQGTLFILENVLNGLKFTE